MSKPTIIDLLINSGRTRRTGTVAAAVGPVEDDFNPFTGAAAGAGVALATAAGVAAFITGIDTTNLAENDVVTFLNVSASTPITFFDADPASAAGNRLVLPDRLPLILRAGQAASFICQVSLGVKFLRCVEWSSTSRDPVHGLPPPSQFFGQTSYSPAGYFWCDESGPNTSLVDTVAYANLPVVGATSQYNRYIGGFKGITIPANGVGFAANQYAPALASQAAVWEFSMPAHNALDIGIGGYDDIAGSCFLLAAVRTADDKVQVQISDQGGAHTATVVIDHVITFGDRYCLVYHVNRTTDILYTRLVNMTTGLGFDGAPLDISAYVTIVGTVAPLFQVGFLTGRYNGTTITQMGLTILTAGIEGADVAANLTKRLTGT